MAQTPVGVINPGVLEDNNSTQSGALARSLAFSVFVFVHARFGVMPWEWLRTCTRWLGW